MIKRSLILSIAGVVMVYCHPIIAQDTNEHANETEVQEEDQTEENETEENGTEEKEDWQTKEQTKELETQIRGKIQAHLQSNAQNERVDITIANGVVIITGNVSTQEEKDNIEKEAKETSGVKKVLNLLKVNPPTK